MNRILCYLLFMYVYVGTKFVSVDKTILSVQKLGLWLRQRGLKTTKSTAAIDSDIKKSYKLVPFRIVCLDLAIIYWFYFNLFGHKAILNIGLSIFPVFTHAWVQLGDEIFVDSELLADLSVTATYNPWNNLGIPTTSMHEATI
jgi:hypothetical protein